MTAAVALIRQRAVKVLLPPSFKMFLPPLLLVHDPEGA